MKKSSGFCVLLLNTLLILSVILSAGCDSESGSERDDDQTIIEDGESLFDDQADIDDVDTNDDTSFPDSDTTIPGSGKILFSEDFEDTNFESRGWYDALSGELSSEHIPGSTSSLECIFKKGETSCSGGTPGRHLFEETESVYLSYWVKYSDNYIGSGKPYHPHEFNIMTNKDSKYVGPARTRLTAYVEQVGGFAQLALQDTLNVDTNCVLLNNDSFVGCNGSFDTYVFSEERSVCSCNGLMGDYGFRDCFSIGGGKYYSSKGWAAESRTFSDNHGPSYKGDWHFIEAYFKLNSIVENTGVPDGIVRYSFDGNIIINSDKVLMRTGANEDMRFNQFLIAPYIGDGSPLDQTMWIDDLIVATAPL